MINFYIIGVFPESVKDYLNTSILKRAQEKGLISIKYVKLFDFLDSKKERIDDTPYGGGPGMVLKAKPFLDAIDANIKGKRNVKYFFFSPSGTQFTSDIAKKIADTKTKHIVLLSGRYEGIDNRVVEITNAEPISIGPYIITGGELASAIFIDAVSRFIPGVLGNSESNEITRNASSKVYTKPDKIQYKNKIYKVPDVLLSGNHAKIEKWRKNN